MKRAILRLLTREYDPGIIAREIIKQRHEPGQIRVKVKVRNGSYRRLSEACAIVKLEEIKAEEARYLQEQALQLQVSSVDTDTYAVSNPESGSHYQVKKVFLNGQWIWDCDCLHFSKMGRRDCKHAMAAYLYATRAQNSKP